MKVEIKVGDTIVVDGQEYIVTSLSTLRSYLGSRQVDIKAFDMLTVTKDQMEHEKRNQAIDASLRMAKHIDEEHG